MGIPLAKGALTVLAKEIDIGDRASGDQGATDVSL
jgi:hypothetical protein